MASILATNVASLRAQQSLSGSIASSARAIARLSSGRRINGASDDSAGLAISEHMTAQIRGLVVASRNTRDGVSLTQTADDSLGSIDNNLQRLRELAVQAANASNSSTDRASLQTEAAPLVSEIDRVAAQASFNGLKLLDGTFLAQSFQVGAGNAANQHITLPSLGSARTSTLGLSAGSGTPPVTTTNVTGSGLGAGSTITGTGQLIINGVDVYQGTPVNADAADIAGAINAAGIAGLSAAANPNAVVGQYGFHVAGNEDINIDSAIVIFVNTTASRATDVGTFVSYFNAFAGVIPTASAADNGDGATITVGNGHNLRLGSDSSPNGLGLAGLGIGTQSSPTTFYSTYGLTYTGSAGLSINGSKAAALGLTPITATPPPASGGTAAIQQLDISTVAGANAGLASLDAAIASVDAERALLGATENRFAAVLGNIDATSESASASRSRIVDADYAAESTALARSQILQDAGVAMVAQANASTRLILALLK